LCDLAAILLKDGLRDYGIEPQVWGGSAPYTGFGGKCEHEWQTETRTVDNNNGNGSDTAQMAFNKGSRYSRIETGFCRRCNAWRGSLGLEPTPALYVEHMVAVFREVRRVLRKDGVCFINIGDCYATGQGKSYVAGGGRQGERWAGPVTQPNRMPLPGLKPKDLIGIPWALAFALRDEGWYLRSEITWAKRAPMPESCTDRPTSATEKVFLLTKSARYFYDAEAVKEEFADESQGNPGAYSKTSARSKGATNERQDLGFLNSGHGWNADGAASGRNMRNWWLLGPEPFPLAHFAVYPTEIPRRAILAGTSERGVCPKCGAPWTRVTNLTKSWRDLAVTGSQSYGTVNRTARAHSGGMFGNETETIGWRPTCSCDAGDPIPGTVLDPFLGAGTTALVADRLSRNCIGIELSPAYAAMAENRLRDDAGMFAELAVE
jgi:DNA modification methylase